jgi:DNA-binding response OmpR family regulator
MATTKKLKKILIVDDEKPIANALSIKLQKEGYTVEVVSNGKDAISKIEGGNFNLVFLDLMMPQMSGFEVLEKLQGKKSKPPIIVSSNLSQNEDVKKAKSLGAVDYFVKSNTPLSEAVARVKKFLG